MNGFTVAALLALALLLPTAWATNHDTETDQTTADLVDERAAESAQLQADEKFAEVSHAIR